jgi:tyrosine-protein kinase Etk/Wzc
MNTTGMTAELLVDKPHDDEISLTDILVALGQEKKTLLSVFMLCASLSLAVALLLPRKYVASTVLLPPQQQSSSAASALAQLGALGGMAGSAAGVKSPDEMYIALLKSRSVQDGLIAQFKLKERYGSDTLEQTRKMLGGQINISGDKKSGFITVEATDKEAVFSAQLANAHVGELRKILTRLALTDAQQRRMFFEQQVNKTKAALNNAEFKFRQTQASSGLVVTQALAEAGVKEGALLRGQIAAREVQQQTLARFATPEHPEAQRVSAELSALRRQLADIEQGTGKNTRANANGTQAVQAFRDMKVQEAMLETLIKQLEIARADEAKEGPLLQQVDQATAPERPSKPKRSLVVVVGTMAGLLLGLVAALLNHARKRSNGGDAWQRVKAAWASQTPAI